MIEILEYLEKASHIISLFAVVLIVAGFVRAAWRYARRFRDETHKDNFNLFKVELGSALLLGLEVLVLADVIETITVTPTNDGPIAVADAYDAVEGQTLSVVAPGVLANDVDVDGDGLTALQGAVVPAGSGVSRLPSVPNAKYSGCSSEYLS